MYHYKKHLDKKEIAYSNINSLDFLSKLNQNDNLQYFNILDYYYNPISINDTGIYLKNEKMINYGQKITITNFKKIIDKHPSLKNGRLDKLNAHEMELFVNEKGLGFNNGIAEGKAYDEKGNLITNIYDYYILSNQQEDFITFFDNDKKELAHMYALKINKKINSSNKNEIINKYSKEYQEELDESLEPAYILITLDVLMSSIEENLVSLNN